MEAGVRVDLAQSVPKVLGDLIPAKSLEVQPDPADELAGRIIQGFVDFAEDVGIRREDGQGVLPGGAPLSQHVGELPRKDKPLVLLGILKRAQRVPQRAAGGENPAGPLGGKILRLKPPHRMIDFALQPEFRARFFAGEDPCTRRVGFHDPKTWHKDRCCNS